MQTIQVFIYANHYTTLEERMTIWRTLVDKHMQVQDSTYLMHHRRDTINPFETPPLYVMFTMEPDIAQYKYSTAKIIHEFIADAVHIGQYP